MKSRIKANLALTAFLTACLIPSAGMLILPEGKAAANQNLAPQPQFLQEDNSLNPEFFQEVSDYVADHFALRQELITAGAVLDAAVFQVSSEEDVALGREGWLFYQETLEDHLHTNPLSGRQLWAAARTLGLIQEYAGARGARLYVTVAPNKASLYPQYLPPIGEPLAGEDDIDRLVPLLNAEGISYLDLFAPFRAQEETLYYRLDSHWNVRGAAFAHDVLMENMGKTDQEPFFSSPYAPGEGHRGDLYEMLCPAGNSLEEDVSFTRPFTFAHVRQPRGPDDQRIETQNPDRSGSLLMFRDSFGNNLYPFMAQEFGSALFSRSMPYQLALLDQSGADTVVGEIVERNLDYLATRAPVLPAPERLLTGAPPPGQGQAELSRSDKNPLEGFVCLEGVLTGPIDGDSPIYVQMGERLYEASPAGADWDRGAPFTLYVPEAACGEGSILCFQEGALCTVPFLLN